MNTCTLDHKTLTAIMDVLPAMVYVQSEDHRISFANRAFIRRFGEPAGRTCHEIIKNNPSPCPGCTIPRVLSSGEPSAYEYQTLKGPVFKVHHSAIKIGDEASVLGVCLEINREDSKGEGPAAGKSRSAEAEVVLQEARDLLEAQVQLRTEALVRSTEKLKLEIEERKQTEDALRQSEEKYSSLVENSLIGIYILQGDTIVFANERFCDINGYDHAEVIGMAGWRLVHPADRAKVAAYNRACMEGRETTDRYEVRGVTKDRKVIWVVLNKTRIQFKGKPAVLGNLVDITPRKRAEAHLKKSEKELRILSSQLMTAQESERKRIALELHDTIAQSLVTIKFTLAQKLKQMGGQPPPPGITIESVMDLIQDSITEIRRIMMALRPSLLDDLGILATINWHCREYQAIYKHIAIAQNIRISEEEVPENLKIVIFRILQESMNNIARHSDADWLRVSLARVDGSLMLEIEDNGRGFDYQEALSRMSNSRGMGLPGMRERTEHSLGRFQVTSTASAGTRVSASWKVA